MPSRHGPAAPLYHPGLVPGSRPARDTAPRKAGRGWGRLPWTPEQVHCCPVQVFHAVSSPMSETVSVPFLSPRTCSGVQNDPETGARPPDRLAAAWTPEQVRGDSGGVGAGVSPSVSRSGRSAHIPPVPRPCAQSTKPKPDTNGTSPGMTTERGRRRSPTLSDLVSDRRHRVPQRMNRTAVGPGLA